MRRILLLFCLAAGPVSADPAPDRLSFLIGSHHFSPGQDFEEFNPGVFLTWDNVLLDGRADLNLGVFRNSYGRTAVAATGTFPVWESGAFEAGFFAGAAYYPEDGRRFRVHIGDVVPLGGIQASYGPAFVQLIPGDGREADAVISFGVTWKIGR